MADAPLETPTPVTTDPPKAGEAGARRGRGRPKGSLNAATREIQAIARDYTTAALKTLAMIAKSGKKESARVAAATALLDRGWGRPRQAVEHSGEGGGPVVVSVTHEIVDPLSGNGH